MDSHTHVFNGSFSDVGVNLSLADTREKLQVALETIRDANPGSGPSMLEAGRTTSSPRPALRHSSWTRFSVIAL